VCVVRGAWCVVRGAWCVCVVRVRGAWCVRTPKSQTMNATNGKSMELANDCTGKGE
jgi:hypothetical protein